MHSKPPKIMDNKNVILAGWKCGDTYELADPWFWLRADGSTGDLIANGL